MANNENLKPLTTNKAREIGRKGGLKSGEKKRERKMMSQIYAEFLEKEHDIIGRNGEKEKIEGSKLLNRVMSKVLSRGDSASVSMMREIREGTEGNKVNVELNIPIADKRISDYMDGEDVDNLAKNIKK